MLNAVKRKELFYCLFLVLVLIIFSGCATKITADKKLIDQFKPALVPEKKETVVYVIRQNALLGAARGLYVGLNDEMVANIHSGQHCYFKVDDGINTMNLEQVMPFHFYRLENHPGETLYLYFEMTSGKLLELSEDLGITAVMKSKQAPDLAGPKPNRGYTTALLNPGLLNLYLMKETAIALESDADNATIFFIRPQSYAKELAFGIWSENQFLGNLKGETYFQIKVPAGKHNFIAKSEHFSVLEAEVEAGKTYYVQVAANMGWAQAHIRLLPVTSETAQEELQNWLDNSIQVAVDDAAIDALIQERLDLALPYIKTALKNVNEGKAESRSLSKGDAR